MYALGTRNLQVSTLFGAQTLTVTGNSASADVKGTSSGGQHEQRVHINLQTVTGTTPTIVFQAQDSPDNTTFTNIIGATTATLTAAGATDFYFKSQNRYVRLVATLGGTTPAFTLSADLYEKLRTV